MIGAKDVEMFVFQYDGMFQKIWPGEDYSRKDFTKADLDAIITLSQDYRGQKVILAFDNNNGTEAYKYPVGSDLLNSTLREGILKKINETGIFFEDSSIVLPTKRFIDMVRYDDLGTPEPSWISPFVFRFFYHSRGQKTVKQVDPIAAFKEGMLKYARPKAACNQAFLSYFCSPAYDSHINTLKELTSKEYEEYLLTHESFENKTFVINCYRKAG